MPPDATHSPFAAEGAVRIDALGETALLRSIRGWLGSATPPSPHGIGDDCAVWPTPPAGEQLLFTTDAVVYGRHFDASCPPELAAAKLLKRNLSDIAAMGGTPHSALLALTLPRNLSLQWLEHFYLGLRECSLRYQTPVTGGDITEGTDNFFAAHITLIGHAKRPVLRTGAQVGDHLFVTGALGGSIQGHHLHFEPRLPQGQWLATQPDVRAMIDITDGLAKDLPELLGNVHVASHVEMSSGHFQTEGQQSPLVGGQIDEATAAAVGAVAAKGGAMAARRDEPTGKGGETTVALLELETLPATTAAMLNLEALPTTTAALAAGHSTVTPQQPTATANHPQGATTAKRLQSADTDDSVARHPQGAATTDALPPAIARALLDGEDYELLFAVDGKTDPAEFIARWQKHFGQPQAPVKGTPTQPQPAYPYRIGQIAATNNHPAGASRLYDAATGQPLQLAKGGFQHL